MVRNLHHESCRPSCHSCVLQALSMCNSAIVAKLVVRVLGIHPPANHLLPYVRRVCSSVQTQLWQLLSNKGSRIPQEY